MIREWKGAFGNQPGYKAVHDVFVELEREGFVIAETQVASASFIKQPPEWVVGDKCYMCLHKFSRLWGYFRVREGGRVREGERAGVRRWEELD